MAGVLDDYNLPSSSLIPAGAAIFGPLWLIEAL